MGKNGLKSTFLQVLLKATYPTSELMMTTMRALFKSTASNGKGTGKANTNTTVASAAQTDNPNGMSTPPDEESPNTKQTQARRAQVRSAQIKHRQKKANHISELEGDVGKYRDLIAVTEKAAGELRMENEVIRRKLLAAGIVIDGLLGQRPQQDLQLQQQVQQHTPEDLTVTLAMSKVMGTPSLSVSSRSASTPDHWGLSPSQPGASPYSSHDDVWLTVAQEETAVNFILSSVRPFPLALSLSSLPHHNATSLTAS